MPIRRRTQALIVVGVVAALLAVLAQGVCSVRDAAARMTCQCNGKQLGIAWWNYHDANGHTVPGTYPNPDLQPEQRLSWGFALQPFIECDEIYFRTDKAKPWADAPNQPFTMAHSNIFTCPAAPDAETTIHTTYFGVAGVGPDAATLPSDAPRIGAFGYDRTLKREDITDGISNTLLLLETRSGGPWAQGGPGTVRGLDQANRPHHGLGRPFDGPHGDPGWWRKPTSTVTATLCDGSVRTLRESVAPEVLEALATVRGKEEVSEDW